MGSMSETGNESRPCSGIVVWAALRQLEALRESLAWTLNGKFLFRATEEEASYLLSKEKFVDGWTLLPLDSETLPVWLRQQGLMKFTGGTQPSIDTAIESYRLHLLGPAAPNALRFGQLSAQDGDDFGAQRSGAGWFRTINFCITSAFVRLLGAWEQYEIDVLKALFYHRPTGQPLGPAEERILTSVKESVIREVPTPDPDDRKRFLYAKPPVWTWVKKHVENSEERRKILALVFDIEATPGTNKERVLNNSYRKNLQEKRNAIAHGRNAVEITLAEYVEADVFVYRSVVHLAQQCRERHTLIV